MKFPTECKTRKRQNANLVAPKGEHGTENGCSSAAMMASTTHAVMRTSPARVLRGGRGPVAAVRATSRGGFQAAATSYAPKAGRVSAARPAMDVRARAASSAAGATEAKSPLYLALEDCQVFRVSDASKVKLTEMWKPDERALVAFGRHFG